MRRQKPELSLTQPENSATSDFFTCSSVCLHTWHDLCDGSLDDDSGDWDKKGPVSQFLAAVKRDSGGYSESSGCSLGSTNTANKSFNPNSVFQLKRNRFTAMILRACLRTAGRSSGWHVA
jgi:hypothetical protein